MTSPAFDPLVASLAAGLAVLTGDASRAAAAQSTAGHRRCTAAALAADVLALGIALCASCLLEALALAHRHASSIGAWNLLAALAVACAGELCALLFVAGREPDGPALAGSAFSFTVAVAATQCLTLPAPAGPLGQSMRWSLIGGSLAAAFLVFMLSLRFAAGKLREHARRRAAARAAAAIGIGAAILGAGAGVVSHSLAARTACCADPVDADRYVAIAIASFAAAVLIITRVSSHFRLRLEECRSRDRHDLEEAHARLRHIATHDVLTGLPNRNLLNERLAKSLAERHQPGRTIAVAALDLDRFSAVNHSLGHGVGDGVLAEIARRLESAISSRHTLARVGGDSFALLIDGFSARIDAHAVTSAMLAALEVPLAVHGEQIRACLSIGVSVWPDDARRGDDLLAHAEAALETAKRSGGGRVLFFEPGMSDSMQERLALENDLRRALAAGEFEIHYQPQVSTATGRVLSVEALLRWRHPTKGLITPSSFIPLAEQTGIILPLGEWVLREVCRQARSWCTGSGLELRVAVNVSAVQFRHGNIVDTVVSALNATQLPPQALEIELTESTLITDREKSSVALKQLRSMGVSVAIDDFGTGYSSLSYLRRLPIDTLKIDRSFIRDLSSSRTDESIVRAIVSLAHSVGLQVVAEGVETAEQLDRIRALECDQWQGYYCCPPQPAATLGELLQERNAVTTTGIHVALSRISRRL